MDTILVGTEIDPQLVTHDVSLFDGDKKVGFKIVDAAGNQAADGVNRIPTDRNAVKTTSGDASYSDLELPWGTIVQDSWAGGRASKWFETDRSKYMDSGGVNTHAGYATLAKQEQYSTGYRSQDFSLPGSMRFLPIIPGSRQYFAIKYLPTAAFTAANIWIWVKKVGTPANDLIVSLCQDNTNKPGTALKTATLAVATITDVLSVFQQMALSSAQAISAGTTYWIKISSAGGTSDDHWEVGYNNATGLSVQSDDDTTWTSASIDLYYRITDADVSHTRIPFNYKYAQYFIENTLGAAPKLYINGDRGVADSNSGALGTLIDATKSWTPDEFIGAIVWVIEGPGSEEDIPYRTITDNDATTLTVDSAWLVTHTTATAYVIVAARKWREITGHGLTVPVTDIEQASGFVYFAQGDAVALRRYQWYVNSGAAAERWAADGTNMAYKLAAVQDANQGGLMWKANNSAGQQVARADQKAYGTWGDLTFGTALTITAPTGRINKIAEAGDPKELYIFTEGSVHKAITDTDPASATDDRTDEIPLKEIRTTMSLKNGVSALMHNVYLYFNLGSGVEQFYASDMVDLGPNRGEGLPENRRGFINHMLGYPGSILMAVNAGASKTSSLLNFVAGNHSYHEEYRAPKVGYEIDSLAFQTIPGDEPDRLWISVGPDVIWLPYPSDTFNLLNDTNMRFRHEGYIESGYSTASMIDTTKIYNAIKLWCENLSDDDGQSVRIQYQTEDSTDWEDADDLYDESPIQENTIGGNRPVKGKRIKYRAILQTTDSTKTPQLKSVIIESVIRITVKYAMSWNYRAVDADIDIHGKIQTMTGEEKQALIDYWAENFIPLYMRTNDPITDKKVVWIDPIPTTNRRKKKTYYTGTIVATELRKTTA